MEETLGTALALAEETGGALDPTLYPVVEAWGFTRERQQVPADETLRETMARTGWERLRLSEAHCTGRKEWRSTLARWARAMPDGKQAVFSALTV